jgi:hypothetical protein
MVYCEPRYQDGVSEALEAAGLYRMDFQFDRGGAQVVMNSLPRTTMRGSHGVFDAYAPQLAHTLSGVA